MKKHFLGLGTAILLGACGEERGGVSFNPPSAAEIVSAATPSALVATTNFNSFTNGFSPFCDSNCTGSQSDYLAHLTNYVFKQSNSSTVEGPAYYLYWIDKAEDRLDEIRTRLRDANKEDTTACYNSESKEVTFSFPIGGETITLPMKFQCYSNITGPAGGSGKFIFGKDDNYYYMTDLYKDAGAGSVNNEGQRFVFTRVSQDGVDTDVWFIGDRYTSGGSYTGQLYNAQRVYANKTSKAFYWNKVEDPRTGGSGRDSIYAQSNGTDVYLEALTATGMPTNDTKTAVPIAGMDEGNGLCVSAADITQLGADCSGIDSDSLPERVGLSSPMHFHTWLGTTEGAPVTTQDDAFDSALEKIFNTDFSAAGVSEF